MNVIFFVFGSKFQKVQMPRGSCSALGLIGAAFVELLITCSSVSDRLQIGEKVFGLDADPFWNILLLAYGNKSKKKQHHFKCAPKANHNHF